MRKQEYINQVSHPKCGKRKTRTSMSGRPRYLLEGEARIL